MHRILVVANETCPCPALLELIAERAGAYEDHEVHLVAPALNSRVRHYVSDTDEAVDAARERLDHAVGRLCDEGVRATGDVGDGDPWVALQDALADFDADVIMLSTHPPQRSHWLERGFVDRAQADLDVPVEHLVSEFGVAPL